MSEGKKLRILANILGTYYVSNDEYLFFCPSCNHHKRKLSVNVNKNVFKCWICDYTGSSIRRLIRRYGDHQQRIEWGALTNQVDITSFSENLFDEEEVIERVNRIDLPTEFISLANSKLPISSRNAQIYLKKRGITKKDAIYWKIGYCPSGLYSGRIVVPSFDEEGYCNYFIARSYDNNWKKYMNPPSSKDVVFNHLYLDFDSNLVVVEGVFDAIVAGPNAVPLLGSTLKETSKLFQEIVKNDTPIYIALDPDASEKENKLIRKFLNYGIEVYKVDISPYNDVGEMSKKIFLERKNNAISVDNDNYLLENMILSI